MNKIGFNKPYLTGKEIHYLYEAFYLKKLSGDGKFVSTVFLTISTIINFLESVERANKFSLRVHDRYISEGCIETFSSISFFML